MNQKKPSPYTTHDSVWLLLPWYVNRSLDDIDQELVRNHLRVCLMCNKELEAQEALARTLRHAPEPAIACQPSFERLMSRIRTAELAATPRPAKLRPRSFGRWSGGLTNWMRPGPWTMALATALLLAAIPLLRGTVAPITAQDYRTVANPGSLSRFGPGDVRVVFADEITEKEIAGIVTAVHGRIVDGPTAAGAYTLRVADGQDSEPLLAAAIQRLRAEKSVLLAEPALPPTTRPIQEN